MNAIPITWYEGLTYDLDPDDSEILRFDMTEDVGGDPISLAVVSAVNITASVLSWTPEGVVAVSISSTVPAGTIGSVTVQVQMDTVGRRRSRTLAVRVREL